MFNFFKIKKKSQTPLNIPLFHGKGIIDVTNFDAMSPSDPLGYMCGCDISVFVNGQIQIFTEDKTKDLLESFSVLDIVRANNNINNFDPNHITDVSLTTKSKALQITFQTKESKDEFWNTLTTTYDNLKERK